MRPPIVPPPRRRANPVPQINGAVSYPAMQRILVLGCSGAGKSTLARRIASRLGLPVVHLDREYWRPGWCATPADEFDTVVDRLVAPARWVMDGNFKRT